MTDGFFAASNSGEGFKNYYLEIFGRADRIFVIKGGPGTGKSRFIRTVSEHAAGRGWKADLYRCSSDPSSYDGVLLTKDGVTMAVIDGTPPHTWEPGLPGIRDTIINLGEFWDEAKLVGHKKEIREINEKKSALWETAYRWLSGCLDMCEVIRKIGEGCADVNKIKVVAKGILAGVPAAGVDLEGRTTVRPALIRAVGMDGVRNSDEYIRKAKTLYCISDSFMTGGILIRAIMEEGLRKGLNVLISYDPVDSSYADGVFIDLEAGGIAAILTDDPPECDYIHISMDDLIYSPGTQETIHARHAERCRTAMLAGAVDALGEIKKLHMRLEEIYSGAMDFSKVNEFTKRFCDKYFT